MFCVAIHVFQTVVKFYDDHIKYKNYDYGNLPPHIIAKILTHLNTTEFRNASVACKSWYYASSDPRVTRNLRVNFWHDSTNCSYLARPIQNARFDSVKWSKLQHRKILKDFGSTISELEIYADLSVTRLFELFIYLPNIKSLKISDRSRCVSHVNFHRSRKITKYKDVIIRNLSQIKKMEIWTSVRDLKFYRQFLSYCNNIEEMQWSETENITETRLAFVFNFLLNPNENPALYNLVELKLNCIDRKQNSKLFEKLVRLELRNIKRLTLNEISSTYYDTMFKEFCKTYPFLEHLTLTGCNDQQLADICNYIKKLKCLTLYSCTANNLKQLLNLNNLEELRITLVDVVVADNLLMLFSKEHKQLKKLQVGGVDFNILKLICENCKNLIDLSISELATKDCEPIFQNMVKLKILYLTFTEPPQKHSSRLRSSDRYNITNLTQLEELYVGCYVPGITPELIQRLPKLKKCWEYIWDPTDEDLALSNWNDEEYYNNQNQVEDVDTSSEEKTVIYNISDFNWCQELIL